MKLLHQSEGSILDDEILINTLRDSKETSNYVQIRVKEAEETEQHISILRNFPSAQFLFPISAFRIRQVCHEFRSTFVRSPPLSSRGE